MIARGLQIAFDDLTARYGRYHNWPADSSERFFHGTPLRNALDRISKYFDRIYAELGRDSEEAQPVYLFALGLIDCGIVHQMALDRVPTGAPVMLMDISLETYQHHLRIEATAVAEWMIPGSNWSFTARRKRRKVRKTLENLYTSYIYEPCAQAYGDWRPDAHKLGPTRP